MFISHNETLHVVSVITSHTGMTEIQPHYSPAIVSEDNQILSVFLILYD